MTTGMAVSRLRVKRREGRFFYFVKTARGILESLGRETAALFNGGRAAIITDGNVKELYLDEAVSSLRDAGIESVVLTIAPGETSKNFQTLTSLLEQMARAGLTRSDAVVALGGGVVGDIAGFAAGCYMRGVPLVQVPTTLLAAVDSSVGGKTAVDLSAGKNLAGLFYPPRLVLCDTNTFASLPEREYLCGLSEALKTGVLSGGPLFEMLEKNNGHGAHGDLTRLSAVRLKTLVTRCVKYKAGVVSRDEKEQGERRLLNLGHTAGHAIELLSGYKIPHGLAVAMGLGIITRASKNLNWCHEDTAQRILNTLKRNGLPVACTGPAWPGFKFSAEELAHAALSDKKRSGDNITLVIPAEIGACELRTLPASELKAVFEKGMTGE